MRANIFTKPERSPLASYVAGMSAQLVNRRSDAQIRAARAEAARAIKARAEFLANMNHELRTPLNAIMGFAGVLRGDDGSTVTEERRREYADYILQSAQLLLTQIDAILDVAALESGDRPVDRAPLDLAAMLADALARAATRADNYGVVIERKDDGAPIMAEGDETRLAHALDHVLACAVANAGEGGRVMARASLDERGCPEIAVRDDGPGLSDVEIRDALRLFDKADSGLARGFSAPDVGYAIAKGFIELQGGAFSLRSRVGQGALVRLALPRVGMRSDPHATDREGNEYAA